MINLTEEEKMNNINLINLYYKEPWKLTISDKRCIYRVKNNFFKPTTSYKHKEYIKKIKKYIGVNKNIIKYDAFKSTTLTLKRIVYKNDSKNNGEIPCNFFFNNMNLEQTRAELYLATTNYFTMRDTTKKEMREKYNCNEIKFEFKSYGILTREQQTLKMKCNSTQNSNGFNIYQFIIITNEKSYITEPFSLISFRQFSKRCENSFLGKKFKNNEPDIYYYTETLFKENSDEFNENFDFKLEFYEIKNYLNIDFYSYQPYITYLHLAKYLQIL